jgi:tRNA(Ile)-lysidine synthase
LVLQVPPAAAGGVLVAYSGGLDSTVLLHALAQAGVCGLRAAHVHHGLQPQADAWAAHCTQFAAGLRVPFELLRVSVASADRDGPEAAARRVRYAALRGLLRPGEVLATAHQRADQAETVLLRLLRGSGPVGLAAMRPLCPFAPGWLWRPLLDTSREALHDYARRHGLRWIEDPHNRDARYARSWLRTELLPRLRDRFPHAEESLARSAQLAAEAADLLAALAELDWRAAARGPALSVAALLALDPARRHNLLRHWLGQRGLLAPSRDTMRRLDREVLAAASDAAPLLRWNGCELRRYRDALYAMPPLPPPPDRQTRLLWTQAELELPAGCGRLRLPRPPRSPLTVRFARGAERFKPSRGSHHRTLRNLFQERGVPPWVRLRTPLVETAGRLVYVAGVGPAEDWASLAEALPEWLEAPPGAVVG